MATIQKPSVDELVPRLLVWFEQNARDLPWRRTRDPYAIWVSEIMLQQTQVKTVVPYWNRWMRELPTIKALAEADSRKLHKLWEGLGYYTRVRNLHRAAQFIAGSCGGRFPGSFEEVLALPGVGRYTAGAICSIVFNQPTPVLDGNVVRVLTRVFAIAQNPRDKATNTLLWKLAQALVEKASQFTIYDLRFARSAPRLMPVAGCRLPVAGSGRGAQRSGTITERAVTSTCSHLNQSLMELGAVICTPRGPQCAICPIASLCVAGRCNQVDRYPNPGPRNATSHKRFAAFLARRNGRFLVRQRPAGAVNAHLWEFPNIELIHSRSDVREAARELLGFAPRSLSKLGEIRHTITRYRIILEIFLVDEPVRNARKAISRIAALNPAGTRRRGSRSRLRAGLPWPASGRGELLMKRGSTTRPSPPSAVGKKGRHNSSPGDRPALIVSSEPMRWLSLKALAKLPFPSAHRRILTRLREFTGYD